ncbi:MlaE family ABC transporter permease [Luteimonas sp. e5]
MSTRSRQPPRIELDADDGLARLQGDWRIGHAKAISTALAGLPADLRGIDASTVDALDSVGVLEIQHHARKRKLTGDALHFAPAHQSLVEAIEDVAQDRPAQARDFGFNAALARLGMAVARGWDEVLAMVNFFGECIVKSLRLIRDPRRLRPVSIVHHMEQVGLDAVPLVLLLNFLVGAVIAFLGANILRDFGATIFVVELVNIAFLREFAVLLTAIVLAGRTASAFTAQIGAMVSREEVDAIRTLGLDPVDVLVLPRLIALLVMLPLLTFLAMIAGLLGGLSVGAFSLGIPPQGWMARMHATIDIGDFWIGLSKAPLFALVIALIGCLQGLRVKGTAQSVGERTTASVVQAISLVIVFDAFAAIWFMHMGW